MFDSFECLVVGFTIAALAFAINLLVRDLRLRWMLRSGNGFPSRWRAGAVGGVSWSPASTDTSIPCRDDGEVCLYALADPGAELDPSRLRFLSCSATSVESRARSEGGDVWEIRLDLNHATSRQRIVQAERTETTR
jgi:hypothetical protein